MASQLNQRKCYTNHKKISLYKIPIEEENEASAKLALEPWGRPIQILGGSMNDQEKTIADYLEPECTGFIYNTARSFLRRHSNSNSLLTQLQGLFEKGEYESCKDMIQLICEEMQRPFRFRRPFCLAC